jgi:DNA-binding response OmpR family regulator
MLENSYKRISLLSRGLLSFNSRKAKSSPSIMLIDDSSVEFQFLEKQFINEGYKIFTANSGLDAFRYAMYNKIEILVLNIQLPILNGFDTSIVFRRRLPLENQPIIVGYTKKFVSKEKVFLSGMDDIVFINNDEKILPQRIKYWISKIS